MVNFFNLKKKSDETEKTVVNEAIEETTEDTVEEIKETVVQESPDDMVNNQFFSKTVGYLTEEKRKLELQAEELEKKDIELQQAYAELLERRKQVSVEQQKALSDFNEASLDYHESHLPSDLSSLSAQDVSGEDGELLDLLLQHKRTLVDMKNVEQEKETLCAELDKELFSLEEELQSVRGEKRNINQTRESLNEAITNAGKQHDEEEKDGSDAANSTPLKSKMKFKRMEAGKVKGINFLNLSTYLKNDCEIDYSVTKLVLNYVIMFIVIVLIGMLYSLKLPYTLILFLVYFIFGPSLIYFKHRKKYERKKFELTMRYLEQMILSFGQSGKLLTALEETRILMTGKLGEAVDRAIAIIRHGSSKNDLKEVALKEIENILPCARVKNLHEHIVDVEGKGGKYETSLDIMLDEIREWDVRTKNFQSEQSVKGVSIIVSILMSLGVCLFMTNILPDDMGGNITGFVAYQVVTTISLVLMFFIYRFSARKLTSSWVNDDLGENEAQIKSDYNKIKRYAENPQGKIKPILAMTRMQTAMDKAFPRWVTRFALLASSKPIPVALSESTNKAPIVMREELTKLNENLLTNPNNIQPYIEFFKDFDLPQVRSMMMMVYSLGSTDVKNVEKHILSIVKRNHLLQAVAEKIEYDEKMALFTLFSLLPMLLACVIMMVDVAMIVFNMLSNVM